MDQRNKWREILGELNASAMSKTENALVKAYRNAIKDIKVQAKGFIEEYDTLSFSKRIEVERLLSVGQEIQAILEGTNKIVTQTIAESTGNMAQNGYYSTFYGLEGEYGLNVPMSFLDEDYIKSVVNSPVDGKTLSQRLYKNTNQLAKTTTQSLIQGAIDGKGYKYVAKRIEDLTEADYKKALRIARTEGGRASSLSQQKAYEEAQSVGVKLKKRWLSTLDEATRNSHRLLDGQTVEAEEAFVSPETGAIGKGPRLMGSAAEDINCRCTTIAVVDGYEPELRLDNETGEMVKNMSYTEWQSYKGVPVSVPKAGEPLRPKPKSVTANKITTREDALKTLNASGFETVNMTTMDTETLIDLSNGSRKFDEAFPQMKGYVKIIETSKDKDYVGMFNGHEKKIIMSTAKTRSENLAQLVIESQRNFHIKSGVNFEHILAHERTHAIEHYLVNSKLQGIEMVKAYNRGAVARDIADTAFKQMGIKAADKAQAVVDLGRYALSHPSELLAQAVADALISPEPLEFSKVVLAEVKRRLLE